MSEEEESDPEQAEGAEERPESAESEQQEGAEEGPAEGASEGATEGATDDGDDDQPEIEADEQASIPDGIDAEEIEDDTAEESEEEDTAESGESSAESESTSSDGEADAMTPEGSASPVKAGELYVTLVHQTTNAAIRKKGDEDAEEVDRDHFADYDLAHYFDLTMEEMGVGSDLEPHEALLLSTALAMGEPILTETDVMDDQIGRLMDQATGAA